MTPGNNKTAAIQTFAAKSPAPRGTRAMEFLKAVGHTFGGIVLVAFGIFMSHQGVPWYAWVCVCVGGFYVIAPRTIKGAVRFILGAVKDVVAAKKDAEQP